MNKYVKNILRIGFILLAFFIEYWYHRSSYLHNPIQGKWNVKQMINSSGFDEKNVESWSNLYFEHDGMCAVSTNPYYYSNKSGMEGDYFYDAATNHLKANFYTSAGQVQTLSASINYISIDSLHMNGIYLEDTV